MSSICVITMHAMHVIPCMSGIDWYDMYVMQCMHGWMACMHVINAWRHAIANACMELWAAGGYVHANERRLPCTDADLSVQFWTRAQAHQLHFATLCHQRHCNA